LSPTLVPPDEQALVQQFTTLLSQFGEVKQLRTVGSLPEARQLMATTSDQFAAWQKDWDAFQKANGIRPAAPAPPANGAGR
jgi:hypothetical protein